MKWITDAKKARRFFQNQKICWYDVKSFRDFVWRAIQCFLWRWKVVKRIWWICACKIAFCVGNEDLLKFRDDEGWRAVFWLLVYQNLFFNSVRWRREWKKERFVFCRKIMTKMYSDIIEINESATLLRFLKADRNAQRVSRKEVKVAGANAAN